MRAIRPSLLTFGIPLLSFLFFSTLLPLMSPPSEPLRRHFGDHLWLSEKGIDLQLVRTSGLEVLAHRNPYPPLGRYPFPPQGLAAAVVLGSLPLSVVYPATVWFVVLLVPLLLGLLLWKMKNPALLWLCPLSVSTLLLSQTGMYALERGNLAGPCAVLAIGAMLALWSEAWTALSLLIAILTSLKGLYLPLVGLLFIVPKPRRAFFLLVAAHLVFYVIASVLYQSPLLAFDFLKGIPLLVGGTRFLYGATNVSLASLISVIFWKSGRTEWSTWVMNEKFSLAVLLIGFGLFFRFVWKDRLKIPNQILYALSFGLLSELTILWQYFSTSYGVVMLLGLVPVCDYLFDGAQDKRVRRWLLVHGALLGLVFSPCEYHIPVTGSFIGLYLLGAALVFVRIAGLARARTERNIPAMEFTTV